MQSEFKGKYHVEVETPEGEKTGPEPGRKLQMTPFLVKGKWSDIEQYPNDIIIIIIIIIIIMYWTVKHKQINFVTYFTNF